MGSSNPGDQISLVKRRFLKMMDVAIPIDKEEELKEKLVKSMKPTRE